MVKWVDVCTFGLLYSDGPVAGPGDGLGDRPGRVQKAKSAKNEQKSTRITKCSHERNASEIPQGSISQLCLRKFGVRPTLLKIFGKE